MAIRQELDGYITREYYRDAASREVVPDEIMCDVETPYLANDADYRQARETLAAVSQQLADAFERSIDAVTCIPYWRLIAEREAWRTAIRAYERCHFTGVSAMGDAADMILDGLLDEETGELIDGTAPGYPRSPERDSRNRRTQNRRRRRSPPGTLPCPLCGKLCRGDAGLAEHQQAKHPTNTNPVEVRQ